MIIYIKRNNLQGETNYNFKAKADYVMPSAANPNRHASTEQLTTVDLAASRADPADQSRVADMCFTKRAIW